MMLWLYFASEIKSIHDPIDGMGWNLSCQLLNGIIYYLLKILYDYAYYWI